MKRTVLWDAMFDALVAGSTEVPASVDATFSWYFRDEDRWLTVESRNGRVSVKPGLADKAEMKFYSSCAADFIHQHATEGAGRAIFQGGGFYWRGDIGRLKEISPLCRTLFGPRLHQRLVGAGITVPKFEVRRYPARTKAQRDRILAEWMNQGDLSNHRFVERVTPRIPIAVVNEELPGGHDGNEMPVMTRSVSTRAPAARKAPRAGATAAKAAKVVKKAATAARAARTSGKKVSGKAAKVARKA